MLVLLWIGGSLWVIIKIYEKCIRSCHPIGIFVSGQTISEEIQWKDKASVIDH